MQTIRIDNSRNKKEVSVLAGIFGFCGVLAFSLIVIRVPLPIFAKIALLVVLLAIWFFMFYKTLKKTNRDKGTLLIDQDNKTFSLNDASFVPYSNLDFYDSSLVGGGRIMRTGPYSSMYITFGTKGSVFKMNDDDASKRLDNTQIIALQDLIQNSSLSDKEIQSFEGWLQRINIKSKA